MWRQLFCLVGFAAILYAPSPGLADLSPLLGSAQDFAVLGGSGITVAGPVSSTTITGDIGTFPTSTITGLENVVLNGVNHAGDAATQQAKSDALTAYTTLAGMLPVTSNLTGTNLGGLTLTPGVYKFDSSAAITGTLTLDFSSNPGGDFVFQIGSTLGTAASNSVVNVIGGDPLSAVYWLVGSSATLGTYTAFAGNILAHDSITLTTGADILGGRAIALNAAVTMDNNTIVAVPLPGALLLFVSGMGSVFAFGRRFFSAS